MWWHQVILVFILGALTGGWAATMAVMTGSYHPEQPGNGPPQHRTRAP
ncbi:hypothetical protein [Mycolicibacterium conceptionense]|nr:hypothetical protein [Mycolicibacterium conceptionense]